jgi:hypothetical protein
MVQKLLGSVPESVPARKRCGPWARVGTTCLPSLVLYAEGDHTVRVPDRQVPYGSSGRPVAGGAHPKCKSFKAASRSSSTIWV